MELLKCWVFIPSTFGHPFSHVSCVFVNYLYLACPIIYCIEWNICVNGLFQNKMYSTLSQLVSKPLVLWTSSGTAKCTAVIYCFSFSLHRAGWTYFTVNKEVSNALSQPSGSKTPPKQIIIFLPFLYSYLYCTCLLNCFTQF